VAKDLDVAVRRRTDGIAQIVPVRTRRKHSGEPYAWTLALVLVAIALYVTALVSAAFVVLLGAVCTAFEVRHARRGIRSAKQPAAEVRVLRRTGTRA
jgi:1,4-dihydroxy-2-naphthoate octaprenyltransferase